MAEGINQGLGCSMFSLQVRKQELTVKCKSENIKCESENINPQLSFLLLVSSFLKYPNPSASNKKEKESFFICR